MRRREREVTDRSEMYDILSRCNTVRIGIFGEDYPYIVPVSFGLEMVADDVVVYFHCAKEGLKTELIQRNPNVCVEGDNYLKVEKTGHGITTRYESVIGFGQCIAVEDQEEIEKGLDLILRHYGYMDYPLDRCKGINQLSMYKIPLRNMTAKRNLPEEG